MVPDRGYADTPIAAKPRSRPRRSRLSIALPVLILAGLSLATSPGALAAKENAAMKERLANGNGAGAFYERIAWGPKARQSANIWASASPDSTIVILVHGGGWRRQTSLAYLKREAIGLQAQGFTVLSINYRQDSANRAAFPLEPNDIMTATHWAIANAASYNGNPAKVVLVGGSAGGNLVALAAERLDAEHAGTVRAVVSLSGPMDFQTLLPLVENGVITSHNFITSIYQALGGSEDEGYFGGEEENEEEVLLTQALEREGSPALNIPRHDCPQWLLFSSEQDLVPAQQSEEMYSDLLAAKCKAALRIIPGSQHAFAYWGQASESIYSFIKAQ